MKHQGKKKQGKTPKTKGKKDKDQGKIFEPKHQGKQKHQGKEAQGPEKKRKKKPKIWKKCPKWVKTGFGSIFQFFGFFFLIFWGGFSYFFAFRAGVCTRPTGTQCSKYALSAGNSLINLVRRRLLNLWGIPCGRSTSLPCDRKSLHCSNQEALKGDILKWEAFLLTVGAVLLAVKLLCLQSLKAFIRRTLLL